LDEETSDSKDKSATLNDNTGKSNVNLGNTGNNNDLSDEDSEAKKINTNLKDPFASLN
jgi:hypothetical protein